MLETRSVPRVLIASSLALHVLTWGGQAHARAFSPEARADEISTLTARAVSAFEAKRFEEAATLFERAYELDPKANLLFNIGRVHEEAGHLEQAAAYYRRFIKEPSVKLEARKVALERLRVVDELLEVTRSDPEPPPPRPVEQPATPAADRPPPSPMRYAGFSLLGIGAASLAAAGGVGGGALVQKRRLDAAQDQPERHEAAISGRRLAIATDVLIGVGSALAVTGIVLTALSYRTSRAKTARKRVRWHGAAVVVDF